MRSPILHRPLNHDEWPNLALLELEYVPRPSSLPPARLAQPHRDRLLQARIVAGILLVVGALIVRACLPGYLDGPPPVVEARG